MMILLTGGAACGKSSYAEDIAVSLPGPRYYIAAMKPYGSEGQAKIARHRCLRAGKGFETVERYTDLAGLSLPERGTVLLECLANLTANEMFDEQGSMRDPVGDILRGVASLKAQCDALIVITNEVGRDVNAYGEGTLAYIEALGRINSAVAAQADCVMELVCGIPLLLKGSAPDISRREV